MEGKRSRKYPPKDLKLLFGLSAGRCAHPDCKQRCISKGTALDPHTIEGCVAHIVAHADGGPRSDSKLSAKERDSYSNWILLCNTHHVLVDNRENTYTIEILQEWKQKHEEWVDRCLEKEVPNVTFVQLEAVLESIWIGQCLVSEELEEINFHLILPRDKMNKNELSPKAQSRLQSGLLLSYQVDKYVQSVSLVKPDFPNRLRDRFLVIYNKMKLEGLRGDELFFELTNFIAPPGGDLDMVLAGLGVVAYLFEKCDLFES